MSKENTTILVIDDEESMQRFLSIMLRKDGFQVATAGCGKEGLEQLEQHDVDVVIQDLKMPGMDGLTLLKNIKERAPKIPVILITAFSTWDTAVQAMRAGAYGYIKKPFDTDNIRAILNRALEWRRLSRKLDGSNTKANAALASIVGTSECMRHTYELIKQVAPTDSTVLITGESGTGKELVASAIHHGSLRQDGPFVKVNCGAFTETLLESELFGHVKGAFTGAISDKKGLFEVADKGTLFLDEIGDMAHQTQVKVLRALENQEFKPVGSTETKHVDVRFVTATNRDLKAMVDGGKFREDLYYRLDVIHVDIPPLRDRTEDVPLLAGHFLAKYTHTIGRNVTGFSDAAMDLLVSYHWPGNVRELQNTVQRAVTLSTSEIIQGLGLDLRSDPHLSPELDPHPTYIPREGVDIEIMLEDIERDYIVRSLEMTGGHISNAGKLLGMSFRSIRYKIKKLEIDAKQLKHSSHV